MGLNSTAVAIQPNVSCTCNCKRSLFQSMEISKYSSCCSRGGCGRCPGCGSARRPRRGRGSSRGGSRRRPGPLAAMRFPGVDFLPPPSEPRSLICCSWDVAAAVTRRGPGWRSCPGSASPGRSPPAPGLRSPLFPIAAPSPSAFRPFPAMPWCLCPAPSPPAGVMLGGPRAVSGGLHHPRVNHPRLGTGGAPRSGRPSRVCIWEPVPPVSSPSGLFVPKGDLGFFINIFQPSQSSSEGSA